MILLLAIIWMVKLNCFLIQEKSMAKREDKLWHQIKGRWRRWKNLSRIAKHENLSVKRRFDIVFCCDDYYCGCKTYSNYILIM